jgi:hypothetical protein
MDARHEGETTVTDLPGDRWLVSLTGEHDVSTADDLREKLRAIFRTGTTVVLMAAERYAQDNECEHFGVVSPTGSVADRLFAIAGVRRIFTTFETVEAAFDEFEVETTRDATTAQRWQQRQQRIVKNEQAFRDYNDRRLQHESVGPTDDEQPIPFVCECGDTNCIQALMITASEFTEAHSAPNRFLVLPGHIYNDVEHVVAEHESFAIVEKHPSAMNQAD